MATQDEYQPKLSVSNRVLLKLAEIQDDFINSRKYPEAKKIALAINASIQKWNISDARQFYLKVSQAFNPHYVKQIELLKKETI